MQHARSSVRYHSTYTPEVSTILSSRFLVPVGLYISLFRAKRIELSTVMMTTVRYFLIVAICVYP